MNASIYEYGADHAVDLLNNAAAVTRFLAEVTESISGDSDCHGISDHASQGLFLILHAVEGTINEAIRRL